MHTLLVASKLDPCAKNMARYIIESYSPQLIEDNLYKIDDINLVMIDEEALYAEWLDNKFHADLYIFLSRHRSESNIPALTSHFTGNFSENKAGGNARELSYTFPSLQKCYMQNLVLKKDVLKDYQIIIEATHHGPTTLTKPLMFIEIGSGLEQWNDIHAISLVCDTILYTLKNIRKSKKIGIAIGGTHYPIKFNKLLIDSEYALSHIASKHVLEFIDERLIQEMINKSIENVDSILLDWKGLSKSKYRIMDIINDLGLEVIKV